MALISPSIDPSELRTRGFFFIRGQQTKQTLLLRGTDSISKIRTELISRIILSMSSVTKNTDEKKVQSRWRARWFLLTLNQPERYEALKKYLTERKTFEYLVSANEVGDKKEHKHMHILACFNQPCILTVKGLQGAMVATKNKKNVTWTREGAHDYVTKDCEIVEKIGEWHQQGRKIVQQLSKINDPSELCPSEFNNWLKIRSFSTGITKQMLYNPDIEVVYIWGDSGVGKSRYVYNHIPDDERVDRVRYSGHFWQGVSFDPTIRIAWYDDFRDRHMPPDEMINFCDYYRNQLDVKGGQIVAHYDKIFITSVQDPTTLWPNMQNEEPKRQWLRRMKIVRLNRLGENPLSDTESE